jgi:hypothetical protein
VGDDTIVIGGTVDSLSYIFGGSGNDFISLTGGRLIGSSSIISSVGDDSIIIKGDVGGASGEPTASRAHIDGGIGNDLISIDGNLLASSSLLAGSGADTIYVNALSNSALLDAGADADSITVRGSVSNSSLLGGDGNDSITFAAVVAGSSINAGEGSNRLIFAAGLSTGTNLSVLASGR